MPDSPPITEKTKVSVNIVSAISIIGAIIYGTVFAVNWMNSFTIKSDDLKKTIWSLQTQLTQSTKDRWTGTDMADYGRDFVNLNSSVVRGDGARGIVVPDSRRIHRDNEMN